MDGTESDDERARCKIWDTLYERGPTARQELGKVMHMRADRLTRLIDHEWFMTLNGTAYVAIVSNGHRQAKVA